MKKILFAVAGALLAVSCTDNNDTGNLNNVVARGVLESFAVTAGSNRYDAVIDHYAGTVKVGSIQNLDEIDGVTYTFSDAAAVIYPEPESFIGSWEKEQTVVVTSEGRETAYNIIFTRYKVPSEEPDTPVQPGVPGWDYPWSPSLPLKDNETAVYGEPYLPFTAATMPIGAPHPNAELAAAGWKLYTVNEFTDGVTATKADGTEVILPHGLHPFDTEMMNESAIVRNEECARIEDGRLIMEAHRLPETINTGKTNQYNPTGDVDYEHASFRAYPKRNTAGLGDWFTLHTYMRFEVRYRRTDTQGFNNAVWFQGNILSHPDYEKNVPWPDYGEIDLLENPKNSINQTAHFTLHCGAYYSGNGKARTATRNLEDMTHWNIFWMELYPDKVLMGVNGVQTLSVARAESDTTFAQWPWDQEDGFYLIFSTGMHDAVHSSRSSKNWQGDVRPIDFMDPDNLPSMEFDWVRVYVNDSYRGEEAMGVFY